MKTKKELIESISIIDGNLSHIESTKIINGTLLIEIERVMEQYAQEQVKALSINDVRLCFPTDEDIEDIAEATIKEGGDNNDVTYWERIGFMDGAKWMREMIKNRNKWK